MSPYPIEEETVGPPDHEELAEYVYAKQARLPKSHPQKSEKELLRKEDLDEEHEI